MSKSRMNEPTAITIPPSSNVPISVRGRSVQVNCPYSARVEVTVRIVGQEEELVTVQFSRDEDPYKVCIVHDDEPPIASILCENNNNNNNNENHNEVPPSPNDNVATPVEPSSPPEIQPGAVHVDGMDLMSESMSSFDELQTVVEDHDNMSGITMDWALVPSQADNDDEEEAEEEQESPTEDPQAQHQEQSPLQEGGGDEPPVAEEQPPVVSPENGQDLPPQVQPQEQSSSGQDDGDDEEQQPSMALPECQSEEPLPSPEEESHQGNEESPPLPEEEQEEAQQSPPVEQSIAVAPCLARESNWIRTVRLHDFKYQWARLDDNGDVLDMTNSMDSFDINRSAYVCRLLFQSSEDPRLRTGLLCLSPASNVVINTNIKSAVDGRGLITYHELAQVQGATFDDKVCWFQQACDHLSVGWNEGHICLNIRREHLLGDSVDAVMSLSRKDMRKSWRFCFIGEEGIDAGGLAREWFQLVTKECFDPDVGLWQPNSVDRMRMEINPASEHCCEKHLLYFRFMGRVLGKAIFDRNLVAGHMVPHIYKHFLSWPITFNDLEQVDEGYFRNLKQLVQLAESGFDLSLLFLDFVTTEEILGRKNEIELVPGGRDMEVDNQNYLEYLKACLKYRVMVRVEPQLTELLLGFFDVIPAPLLTIFHPSELELIMCGQSKIDVDDWMQHTLYTGEFDGTDGNHQVCRWFWEVVSESYDQDSMARLLQFVTGASAVPAGGFEALHGNDGTIRKFTIHGVRRSCCFYPRAHTCFNRIDLPLYDTKEELKEKLELVVAVVATGFHIE